ncbi:MAG: DUF389 domain-containing protein [Sphingomicrobium sp.]
MGDLMQWWFDRASESVDRQSVIDKVHEESGWSSHFAVMTLLSAGIAVLGLLLSSPAVVIGAMLISPLMGPIIGLGFALATFDFADIRRSGVAIAIGIALALLFCAIIVFFSPLQTVTSEIASRTRPNLFDLLVALFSGLAGTYAMIRGRHGAIVGVAIATALMPPLAVIGFGLATTNWPVVAGSTLLFFTNLMTIAASAAVLARIYGFAPHLSPHQTRLQATLIILTLAALAVPLGLSLRQIAQEALANRQASDAIAAAFPPNARVSDMAIDYHADPVAITATVLTPKYSASAQSALTKQLSRIVGRPIGLSLDQIRTASGSSEGQTEVGGASVRQRNAARMAERMALVAGVPVDSVFVDQVGKRVVVRAAPLPGSDLDAYHALEERVASTDRSWSVTLVPPAAPLPDVKLDAGTVDPAAIATAVWAAQRLHLPVAVTGGRSGEAQKVADLLNQGGVEAMVQSGKGRADKVELQWTVPTVEQ